jgi:amyloid beta precursor protein binding protein 1
MSMQPAASLHPPLPTNHTPATCTPLPTPLPPLPPGRLYLKVQRLYRERAEQDVEAVEAHVRTTLNSVGRAPGSISRESVKHFCKNARCLRVIR